MPAIAAQDLLTPRQNDRWLRSRLLPILGDCRLLYTANSADTTTGQTRETSTGQVITWDATIAARLSKLGRGWQQSFASASTQFGSVPDTTALSFGNSTTDQSFSIVALANVTDTAANRALLSKWDPVGLQREWELYVGATDLLTFVLFDESATAAPNVISTAAITQGSWHLFGATFDVTLGSGATAATGMTLYQDGAVIASTPTQAAAYVAMENGPSPVRLGSQNATPSVLLDGSLAMIALCQKALSAADHAAIKALCTRFYGVP